MREGTSSLTAAQFEEWIGNNQNQFFVDFVGKVILVLDVLELELKKLSSDDSGEMIRNRRIRHAKADAADAIRKLL